MKTRLTIVAILLAFPATAGANFANGIKVGVGVSATSGLNVMVGYHNPGLSQNWLRKFGVRIDVANTDSLKSAIDSAIDSYMRDGRDVGDGVRIDDGKLDAWHTGILLDYYPFQNWFRLTGGYMWGKMDLKSSIYGTVQGAPSQRFYFYLAGDHYYYNGNSFDGFAEINWNYHGPYLGTGFDFRFFCGFSLYMDLGIVFASRPAKLSLDVPQDQLYIYNKDLMSWSPVSIPQLDADIEQARHDANRKLNDLPVYPMIKLGVAYRF